MCHEATSVGLPESIGVGKGTVTLEDVDHCDAVFCIAHNPGTNHPRMLTTLREVSKRGAPIIVFNPVRERALERVIINDGRGITQHRHGTGNVQQIANLLMLRGNIGRKGAGISPLRGHSNVQGDRTVGITEIPNDALLDGLARVFGFEPPRNKGHNAVEAVEAIRDGRSKALVCLGGNLAVAMPDPEVTFKAMQNLDLALHIATKLNRSHLLVGKQSLILPCLGRTEIDAQATGPQSITVEDSMSMVHASRGGLRPASEHLKSEPAIIAEIARATLPNTRVGWAEMISDYGKIRDAIEAIFPEFADFNTRVKKPGGFRLYF